MFIYFSIKAFPERYIKRCYLQKKLCVTIWDFIKALVAITLQTHHVYSTLKRRGSSCFHVVSTWNTRGVFVGYVVFMSYIAVWTFTRKTILLQFLSDCDLKMRPSKGKILIWKFFPATHSIMYYNKKSQKEFFAAQKVLRVVKLSDRRTLFDFSVIGSVKGSPVIDSFLGLSVLFFRNTSTFLSKGATTFFIKNRCSVYIFKKTVALKN